MDDVLEIILEGKRAQIEKEDGIPSVLFSADNTIAYIGPQKEELIISPKNIVQHVDEMIKSLSEEFLGFKHDKLYSVICTTEDEENDTTYIGQNIPMSGVQRSAGLVYLEVPLHHVDSESETARIAPFFLSAKEMPVFEALQFTKEFGTLPDDELETYSGILDEVTSHCTSAPEDWLFAWIDSSLRHEYTHHMSPNLTLRLGLATITTLEGFSTLYVNNALCEGIARLAEREYMPLSSYREGEQIQNWTDNSLTATGILFAEGLTINVKEDGFPPMGMREQNCLAGLYVASTILDAFGQERCMDIFLTLRPDEILEKHEEACSLLSEGLGYDSVVPLFT